MFDDASFPASGCTSEHPIAVTRKLHAFRQTKISLIASLALSLPLLSPVTGCTVYGEGKPTLSTTTSAEQTQRIFWQEVKDKKWHTVETLLVANVTWRNGSQVLTKEAIVPYLQQLQVKDFLITDLVVRANANDMTVLYSLQLTTANAAQPLNLHAVSVWQQVPIPADNAPKAQKKAADKSAPYLLTVEDLVQDAVHP